jgi:organic hydroperoxide reductase OsmC/OhrA
MKKFPMKFEVEAQATSGIGSLWTAHVGQLMPITCAIPCEFSGPGGGYTPEDLFALAILNCILATFKVYCERNNNTFTEAKSKAILTLDRNHTENALAMTHADIFIDVKGASNVEKVRHLLDKAVKDCAVSNSIKTGKTFHLTVA